MNCTCGDDSHHGSVSHHLNHKLKEEVKMKRQFFIAGVQFRPAGDIRIAGAKLKVGDRLTLVSEPTNKFDPNAVQIIYGTTTKGQDQLHCHNEEWLSLFLGYVPKKYSSEVSALLGIGAPVFCTVDEVNPAAKTYEMFKVTIRLPIEDEEYAEEGQEEEQ